MSSIQKHPRGYIVRWEAGKTADGRRKRRSKVLASFNDAKVFQRHIAATEGAGGDDAPIGAAMLDWIDTREAMGSISAKSAERQRNIARNLGVALGDLPVHKITSRDVNRAFVHLRQKGGKRGTPLAARTLHHHRTVLSQFMKTLVAQGRVPRNPVEGAERVRVAKVKAEAPTLTQVERLLELCDGSSACNGLLRLVVLTALHTGARRGEILALRWVDVDAGARIISISRSIEQTPRHGIRFKAPKTEAGRRAIPCTATLINALEAHRPRQAEQRLAAGSAWADNDLIFANVLGEVFNPEEISRRVGQLARKAGFAPNVAPLHGLRHLHGTRLNAAGLDAKTIQTRLGHEDVAITLQLYVHADDENAKRAADVFEGLGG